MTYVNGGNISGKPPNLHFQRNVIRFSTVVREYDRFVVLNAAKAATVTAALTDCIIIKEHYKITVIDNVELR